MGSFYPHALFKRQESEAKDIKLHLPCNDKSRIAQRYYCPEDDERLLAVQSSKNFEVEA